ncbi:MAG: hypothetical protein Q9162_001947 [Coniocarpon cinnabarinum]
MKPNPFVETALQYALSYVGALDGTDNRPLPSSNDAQSDAASTQASFRKFDLPINEVNKTGLGSSAALVTALTGAVLEFYSSQVRGLRQKPLEDRACLHRLAQLAHCAAQGKVGSGFDVASAVFGSCIYKRFSPSIPEQVGPLNDASFGEHLARVVQDDTIWDYEINSHRKVSIPHGLKLVMCDVDCGSQTPGMVKQVLKWRSENQVVADRVWDELQRWNDELADRLHGISEWQEDQSFAGLSDNIQQVRRLLRTMSSQAKVPIEPEEQTELLDACSAVPGVIGGVVPGAGGYDAITLLIEDDENTSTGLVKLLESWKFGKHGGKVRLLATRGEMEGVRVEPVQKYSEWIKIG